MTADISQSMRAAHREVAAKVMRKQKECAFTPPCKDCVLMQVNAEWFAALIDRSELNLAATDKLLVRLQFAKR